MTPAKALVLVVAWTCLSVPVWGQTDTAVVDGTVTGESGVPLGGAVVSVRNPETGFVRSGTTGDDGRYVVAGVPGDSVYDVSVQLSGFSGAVRAHVTPRPGERITVDLSLSVAAAVVVTVQGAADTLPDRDRSTLRQTIDESLLQSVPLMGRNFLQLAALTAGFTGSPDVPSPQGQLYSAHNVLVDGASHFSKWRSAPRAFYSGYSLESLREVQVLSSLFSAEYGGALGSVTTVSTKAGTNTWHGSALLLVRHHALDARPAFAETTPPGGSQQYAASIGGPIVRDRLHVWASYEARRTRDQNIVVSPAARGASVPDNQDERLAFIRVDAQAGPRHLLAARYNGQFFRWHDEPGGLALPGTGTQFRNDVHTAVLSDDIQLSSRTVNDVRAQAARYVDVRRDLDPGVFVSRAGYSLQGGVLGPLGFGADPEDTWEAADRISQARGPTTLSAGGGIRYVRSHNASLVYGRGAYFFGGAPSLFPTPFLFMQGFAPTPIAAVADPRSLAGWAFAQDDWAIRPGVTVNAGLRYDVEGVSHVRGFDSAVDTNNVQPRIGVAWDPGAAGRLVIRGGMGLYTQQHLLYPINRVQLDGVDGAITMTLTPDAGAMPEFPRVLPAVPTGGFAPPRDVFRVGPALRNPYSRQATIGLQALVKGQVVAVDYVTLRGYDLLSLVDANAPASNAKPAQRTVAQADATRPLVPAAGTYRQVVTLGNDGRSWYRALDVTASRNVGPMHALGSYVWSRAEDMANYELPEDSRNLAAERGRALADVRHSASVAATWALPGGLLHGFTVSGVGAFRSNRPYTITWGDDRNGTTQGDARPGGRNTGRTGPYRSVDIAVARRVNLGGAVVETRAEAFNLLDTTNYDQYVGQLLSPLFGRPISAFPQRRLQLAAIVRF